MFSVSPGSSLLLLESTVHRIPLQTTRYNPIISMARREPVPLDCKVYVGELGNNGTRHEIEDAFGYYGPLKEVS